VKRRWVRGGAMSILGASIALYAGDWLVFNLRGARTENVMVSHFISAPLHNNKEELDYLGSEEVPCSVSLFPQGGHAPCLYLRGHRNRVERV